MLICESLDFEFPKWVMGKVIVSKTNSVDYGISFSISFWAYLFLKKGTSVLVGNIGFIWFDLFIHYSLWVRPTLVAYFWPSFHFQSHNS